MDSKQKRPQLQTAFVLHQRPYRNTSLIVDFFTEDYGRVTALAQSARGPKSRFRGQLQLFTPMLISWSGTNELVYLNQLELAGVPLRLQSNEIGRAHV